MSTDEARFEINKKLYQAYRHSQLTRQACIELIGLKQFEEWENPPPAPIVKAKTFSYSFVNVRTKSNPQDLAGWGCICIVRDEANKIIKSFMTEPTSKRITIGKVKEMGERIVSGTLRVIDDLPTGFLNTQSDILDRDDIKDVLFLTLQADPWKVSYDWFNGEKFEEYKTVSAHNRADVWQNWQMEVGKWNQQDKSPSTCEAT